MLRPCATNDPEGWDEMIENEKDARRWICIMIMQILCAPGVASDSSCSRPSAALPSLFDFNFNFQFAPATLLVVFTTLRELLRCWNNGLWMEEMINDVSRVEEEARTLWQPRWAAGTEAEAAWTSEKTFSINPLHTSRRLIIACTCRMIRWLLVVGLASILLRNPHGWFLFGASSSSSTFLPQHFNCT